MKAVDAVKSAYPYQQQQSQVKRTRHRVRPWLYPLYPLGLVPGTGLWWTARRTGGLVLVDKGNPLDGAPSGHCNPVASPQAPSTTHSPECTLASDLVTKAKALHDIIFLLLHSLCRHLLLFKRLLHIANIGLHFELCTSLLRVLTSTSLCQPVLHVPR